MAKPDKGQPPGGRAPQRGMEHRAVPRPGGQARARDRTPPWRTHPLQSHCGRLTSRRANPSQCPDKVGQLVHAGGDRSRIRIDIRHRMHQAADQSVILSAGDFNGD